MRILVPFLLVAMTLAGCATPAPDDEIPEEPAPVVMPDHVLDDTVEPEGLLAPTFNLRGPLAAGGPAYGAGEPSAWVALDGTLYVAFPGCDRGFYLVALPTPGAEGCEHGLVYRSHDDGASWERMNRDDDGRYTDDGPAANGDADVATDAAGNVYVSNLGSGIQFHTFWAENQTWEYMANVVPEGEGADRQWMAAGKEGHVIMTWMRTSPERDVEINVTFDGGRTWTHGGNYGGSNLPGNDLGIGWLGTVQIAPDGEHAYIPYTQPTQAGTLPIVSGPSDCAMRVLVSSDGGLNWTDVDTGARWPASQTGGHWSCVQMAPALDVTGDGTVVVAWAQDEFIPESTSPYTATSVSTILYVIGSTDNGTSWTDPRAITTVPFSGAPIPLGTSIMPWVTGGAGDRFAITYLHNPVPTDGDYTAAVWDVRATVIDGLAGGDMNRVDTLVEAGVHAGGIYTRGGACLLTGSDRAFLDFFEADLTPEGQLFVTYPHDLNPGKMIEIRTAIQDGGTPLLARIDG